MVGVVIFVFVLFSYGWGGGMERDCGVMPEEVSVYTVSYHMSCKYWTQSCMDYMNGISLKIVEGKEIPLTQGLGNEYGDRILLSHRHA